eukprot:scaffold153214_cov82-Attheya_sp.AAC.2
MMTKESIGRFGIVELSEADFSKLFKSLLVPMSKKARNSLQACSQHLIVVLCLKTTGVLCLVLLVVINCML